MDGEGKLSPKWLKLPKSPKSPKSPGSSASPKSPRPLTHTERNFDYIQQCMGCNKVEGLIKWNLEKRKNGEERTKSTLLHNNLEELESCSKACTICRVFRQSLLLEEVTHDEIKNIRESKGEITVHWEESAGEDGKSEVSLRVGVEDRPSLKGAVSCNSRNEVAPLALHPNGRDISVFEQAKTWLNNCRQNHVGLCDNLKFDSENPLLLIEILSPDFIQLRKKPSWPCEYVALSYCWGEDKMSPAEMIVVEQAKTRGKNVDQRQLRAFPIGNLPATVRDALHVIRSMGLRYAWIDALCVNQDTGEGLSEMHQVYSNALFTLCACATSTSTAELLRAREAWTESTEPCRLGGQWLTTPDMSLNQLRLRSPLAGRAWTLQEERLSPRMLYISSGRLYWSCAMGNEMELKPVHGEKAHRLQRPMYSASAQDAEMPASQEFLLACHRGEGDLYPFWADIVKSYALRDMGRWSDRLNALSGLAAKYHSSNPIDEYLAGIWKESLPEGLVWKVIQSVEASGEISDPQLPSWSWTVLPLRTAIDNHVKSSRSSSFQYIPDVGFKRANEDPKQKSAIMRGADVKAICVTGRMRPLWKRASCRVEWSSISKPIGQEERFTFGAKPEQNVHALHSPSGRILVYEDRKRAVVGQIDFKHDVKNIESEQVEFWALEIGDTTMLLLEDCKDGTRRRVGAAWDVRKDFFALVKECAILVLR